MRTHTKETIWIQDLASSNHQEHPAQDTSSKQQTKQKYKPSHQQTGFTTSLSLAHQRKNKQKLSTNLTLYKAYTNLWTKLTRAETKKKKEFNLEAQEKETSNTISKKKKKRKKERKKEKAEKYYRNEGTNQKHRSPNKWRGNRQTNWKRIQNNDSKMIKNLENKMEKMQESINKDLEELKNKHTETDNTINWS